MYLKVFYFSDNPPNLLRKIKSISRFLATNTLSFHISHRFFNYFTNYSPVYPHTTGLSSTTSPLFQSDLHPSKALSNSV